MDHTADSVVSGEASPKEYLKFVLVLLAIMAAAFLLHWATGSAGLMEWMRWFMGVFFVTFAVFKLIGYSMFPLMFAGYDVIAKRFKPYAYAYPFIELALGAAYLLDAAPVPRDAITLLIMGVGTIGVVQEVRRRSGIHCACLGNVIKLPLSTTSLVEDVGMGLMAAYMLLVSLAV